MSGRLRGNQSCTKKRLSPFVANLTPRDTKRIEFHDGLSSSRKREKEREREKGDCQRDSVFKNIRNPSSSPVGVSRRVEEGGESKEGRERERGWLRPRIREGPKEEEEEEEEVVVQGTGGRGLDREA